MGSKVRPLKVEITCRERSTQETTSGTRDWREARSWRFVPRRDSIRDSSSVLIDLMVETVSLPSDCDSMARKNCGDWRLLPQGGTKSLKPTVLIERGLGGLCFNNFEHQSREPYLG